MGFECAAKSLIGESRCGNCENITQTIQLPYDYGYADKINKILRL